MDPRKYYSHLVIISVPRQCGTKVARHVTKFRNARTTCSIIACRISGMPGLHMPQVEVVDKPQRRYTVNRGGEEGRVGTGCEGAGGSGFRGSDGGDVRADLTLVRQCSFE